MENVLTYEQLKQRLEAREREVMALVAENSALKKSEIEFNEYCRSECENEGSDWMDDFTETPATTAALAEVEAKAIEKAIEHLHCAISPTLDAITIVGVLNDFAKQLRGIRS